MGFLRVLEVFPPLFPLRQGDKMSLALGDEVERFVGEVRRVRGLGDLFLIANVKSPDLLKLSTVESALLLQDRVKVRAAPVIVVRDMNRLQFLSTVVTAISFELDSLMVAWGDRYPASAGATNVRDFPSLGSALHEVNSIRKQARSAVRLLAPVDLSRLKSPDGLAQARGRLRAGAEYLLAQPPTTDPEAAFDAHAATIRKAGLKGRVLLNVFPFRDEDDLEDCESRFGWRLLESAHRTAEAGAARLFEAERGVVKRLREEGFPGVYVSTRGAPAVASQILS